MKSPKELLDLFGDQSALSDDGKRGLRLVSPRGNTFFKRLMEYWKVNHSDAGVRAQAQNAYDQL